MKVHKEHKELAEIEVRFGIITVSTSRYKRLQSEKIFDDASGDLAEKIIKEEGFTVAYRSLIPDDFYRIRRELYKAIESGCNAIIFIGGTGPSRGDVTIESIKPLLIKELEGFGELFRYLSYEEIGTAAILSRAIAGVIEPGIIVFALPGSPNAVELALRKIITKEIKHLIYISSQF